MALTDYASLESAITNWLNRNNFPDLEAEVPNFIDLAQRRVNRHLRTRHYRRTADVTLDGPTVVIDTAPDEVAEVKAIYYSYAGRNCQMSPAALQFVSELNAQPGPPRNFAVVGQDGTELTIQVGPAPGGDTDATLHYYVKDPSLTDTNTTNITIKNFPGLLLNAALYEACTFLKDDERAALYQQRFLQYLREAQDDEWQFNANGGGYVYPADTITSFGGGALP